MKVQKIQEREEHLTRRIVSLNFKCPQESIYRILQTSAFVWEYVKIIKAEKGSDFWLPFCLWELIHILDQIMAHFISCLKTGHTRGAPTTHTHTGMSAFTSNTFYTLIFSCSMTLCSVAQVEKYSLNYRTRIYSLTIPFVLK